MDKRIAVAIILTFAFNSSTPGQTIKTKASLNNVVLRAWSYFQQIEGQQFDEYLRRIRPSALAPDLRARVINMLPKAELISPTADQLTKLKTLEPILKYHNRDGVIEFRVLRAPIATAVFLAGAAVLITEPALKILTAEELQAVVAHELGHEYYWNRFELARQNHDYSELQELELRCDGLAVVTLEHLWIEPQCLISAIAKLDTYNQRENPTSSQNYVAFSERTAFIRLIADLVGGRRTTAVSLEQDRISTSHLPVFHRSMGTISQ